MIFVVGSSRSGTTMMGHMLGQGQSLFMLNELHFFEELCHVDEIAKPVDRETAVQLAQALFARQNTVYGRYEAQTESQFTHQANALIDQLPQPLIPIQIYGAYLLHEANQHGKLIPIEQTPKNVFYIQEILTYFPNALVINMVRDARDVLLSQKNKWQRFWKRKNVPRKLALLFWANYHPFIVSTLWNSSIEAAKKVDDPHRIITVRFEDVVSDEEILQEICQFIDVPYSPQMRQIPSNSSHSLDDKRRGVQLEAKGRWQRDNKNRRDLSICQRLTAANLAHHGYSISPTLRTRFFDLFLATLTLPIKSMLALLLNRKRLSNLTLTLQRRLNLKK